MRLLTLFLFSILSALEPKGFLTSEEIAQFYNQGYFVKRDALDVGQVHQMRLLLGGAIERTLDELIHASEKEFSEQDQFYHINDSRIVFKRRPDMSLSILRVNGCAGLEPALNEFVRSEKMVQTFFELLGTNDIEQIISQIHPKLPGDGVAFPKHRDIQFRKSFDPNWQDILGNGSYAICIMTIDSSSQENGGLWIDRNNYPEPQGMEEARIWVDLEPGDLLFMHPHLYHGSGPNLSPTSTRRTLLTGFCAYGANHCTYPGADVNVRFTMKEDGSVETTSSPWAKKPYTGPGFGH